MMLTGQSTKIIRIILVAGLLVLGFLIFFRQIDFTSADLGRHLKNGELFLTNKQVLFTNFYSYTEPTLSFINHHWLSGVLFYLIFLLGGFKLLTVLNVLLITLIIFLSWRLATNKIDKTNSYYAAILFVPAILLLSERVEIRPEIISYLFILWLWILIEAAGKFKKWYYWLIFPVIFALWANLHIYFIFGLVMLAGRVLIGAIIELPLGWRALYKTVRPWILVTLAASFAALLNPNTWRGLIYPLNIFSNYGYEVAENKSVFYLEKIMINPNFLLFKILLSILIISWLVHFLFVWRQKIVQWRLFDLFLSFLFIALGLFATRNLALFGLVAAVITARNLVVVDKMIWPLGKFSSKNINYLKAGLALILVLLVNLFLVRDVLNNSYFGRTLFGWGLKGGEETAAQFFINNNLQGPMFNNYDIGSSLIFWLYPKEKVFVDNRPEAYSQSFFTDIYKPMQSEISAWQKYSAHYQIKSIYFSHTDSTPWAQNFLRNILQDPKWALVFFNDSTLILINKNQYDAEIVKKLEIDRKKFVTQFQFLINKIESKNRFNLAAFAELAGYPELARTVYQNSLLIDKKNSRAWLALAYSYANGDLLERRQSLIYFKRVLVTDWQLPEVYNQLAMTYWSLGDYLLAENAWQSALSLDKNNVTAKYYLKQIEDLKLSGKLPLTTIPFSY